MATKELLIKKRRIRLIIAHIIAIMPTSTFRCFLYRLLCGYRIEKSFIGWGTILVVDHAELIESSIGRNNRFTGPMHIISEKGASIGNINTFNCGWWTEKAQYQSFNYERFLHIGMNAKITSNHYFDVAGSFVLGNNSWIAGTGSQFWTHGAGVKDRNITIGKSSYLGSSVRFSPGSSIGDNCILGLGSIVTKKFDVNNAMLAGHPARIVKENYDWKTRKEMRSFQIKYI